VSEGDDEPTQVDKWLRTLKNNPLIAGGIVAGIAITAIIDFGKTVVEPMRVLLPGQGDKREWAKARYKEFQNVRHLPNCRLSDNGAEASHQRRR
jgi:hypothetical protein